MAPKQPCAKYQYVVTASGPKFVPVDEPAPKDEESPADYNSGGYLPIKVNDTFSNHRYRVVRKLGWGHFSTVWLVQDAFTQRHSALKVVKSAGRYADTARDEIKLLSTVSAISPLHPGRKHIVSFLDSFSHQAPESSHICIVFEPLGENLLALIERHKKKGVPRALVRVIARQLILGLEYLHDECDLVHTDIKPENILISIPDIEYHIQNELSQTPSPTSRQVGIPLPGKSRAGVMIPQAQQRSRRQVQIFHSQPLSSPKSVGLHSRLENSSGGSVSSSYVAHMQLSRMGSNHASPGSSVPKVPSGLSTSATIASYTASEEQKITQAFAAKGIMTAPATLVNSSSTSSSSSSVSSAMASTTAGSSSFVNTPPTSNSIGNLREFPGQTHMECDLGFNLKVSSSDSKMLLEETKGIAIPLKQAQSQTQTGLAFELSSAMSTSWKDRVTGSFTSQNSVASQGTTTKIGNAHVRSVSGLSNGNFWKDPGTAAPAPAILVSAVVGADGIEDNLTRVSVVSVVDSTTSESSPATTTVVRPSPVGTPLTAKKSRSSDLALNKNSKPECTVMTTNDRNTTSLLSQTAPRLTSSPMCTTLRNSPPQQVSQLSAHMHRNKPPLNCSCSDACHRHAVGNRDETKSRITRLVASLPVDPDTVDVTPISSQTPAAPPPTPIDPSVYSAEASDPRDLPHLQTSLCNSSLPPPISVKIADLGNATPSKHHFTEDIQTRQYRAPEAILGRRDWDARVDMWSVACVIFELLTAEYLFDPQGQGELFTKDDDHMAQIMELMGDFPLDVKMGAKYSRELFDHTGALRYIKTLKPWPLKRVMIEKYLYTETESVALCDFLEPMLSVDFRERILARVVKNHKWLDVNPDDGVVTEW